MMEKSGRSSPSEPKPPQNPTRTAPSARAKCTKPHSSPAKCSWSGPNGLLKLWCLHRPCDPQRPPGPPSRIPPRMGLTCLPDALHPCSTIPDPLRQKHGTLSLLPESQAPTVPTSIVRDFLTDKPCFPQNSDLNPMLNRSKTSYLLGIWGTRILPLSCSLNHHEPLRQPLSILMEPHNLPQTLVYLSLVSFIFCSIIFWEREYSIIAIIFQGKR